MGCGFSIEFLKQAEIGYCCGIYGKYQHWFFTNDIRNNGGSITYAPTYL